MNWIFRSRLLATIVFVGGVALFIAGAFAAFWISTLLGGDIVQGVCVLAYLLVFLGIVIYIEIGD